VVHLTSASLPEKYACSMPPLDLHPDVVGFHQIFGSYGSLSRTFNKGAFALSCDALCMPMFSVPEIGNLAIAFQGHSKFK